MGKTIDVKNTLLYGNRPVDWKGTVSSDENFVVSGIVRLSPGEEKVKENGVKTQMIARVDMTISLYDKEKESQGMIILPYIAGRMLKITRKDGTEDVFFTADDNDSNRGFKNLILPTAMHDAIIEEANRASTIAVDAAEKGESMIQLESAIKGASKLIALAAKVGNERKIRELSTIKPQEETEKSESLENAKTVLDQ